MTPASPDLERAEQRFAVGDFRETRRLAAPLLQSDSPEVRAGAQEILDSMRPDPVALWVAIGCIALFAAVVYFTLFR